MSDGRDGTASADIAIVGMAGRFPGARDLTQFWDLLCAGREGISRFDTAELAAAGVPPELLADPGYVPAHGVLADADLFDTAYFEMTPAEAEVTDPQHRVFLEVCHEVLEVAGYDPTRFPGLISVVGGAAINTYLQTEVLAAVDQTATSAFFQVMTGNDKDYLATRVAYKLGLTGPAYTVQTACSTSLVAVHLACQSLLNGECDLALAGGVTVKVPQVKGYLYEEGAILSSDGRVRTFDEQAGGTVLGNGVGVVLLRPLRDAIEARDTIHAVIRGTATNNDGSRKVSFSAPGRHGQAAVIRETHLVAGVQPSSISYLEAHGTATRLGDPVEVSALTEAFGPDAGTGYCAIGSVKSNIGHLDAAAGVAGVIKTALMLRHRTLVPTVNFTRPNPAIDFSRSPFYVSTETTEWRAAGPLRAGVSSFGIGGTNAHAVLQEPPAPAVTGASRPTQVLLVSARTPAALDALTSDLAAHLRTHPEQPLPDVAFTLAVGRRAHRHRRAVLCGGDGPDAAARLLAAPAHDAGLKPPPLAFAFADQADPDHLLTGYAGEAAVVEALAACERAGTGARGERGASFATQYALGRLWLSWGLRPGAVYGDGVAALVGACLAGSLTLAAAVAALDKPGSAAANSAGRRRPRFPVRPSRSQPEQGTIILRPDGDPVDALLSAWCAGVAVDWEAYYAAEQRGRVPLPTYPFQRQRYWLESTRRPQAALPALPPGSHRFDIALTGAQWWIHDHVVGGEPVLPAAGYLDLVRSVVEPLAGPVTALRDVTFERPCSFADGPRQIQVEARTGAAQLPFQVMAGDAILCAGTAVSGDVNAGGSIDTSSGGETLAELDADACYQRLRRHGLDYGPRMRGLRQVTLLSGHQAVGQVRVPAGAEPVSPALALHPGLVDAALHVAVLVLSADDPDADARFWPVALSELIRHAPLPEQCQVRAVRTAGGGGAGLSRLDIALTDLTGRPLVTMRGLSVRRHGAAGDVLLAEPRWVPADPVRDGVPAQVALVLATDAARGSALAQRLRGDAASRVVVLERGDSFAPLGPDRYTVDPERLDDVTRLLAALADAGTWPDAVVDACGLDDDEATDPLAGARRTLVLSRALIARRLTTPMTVLHAVRCLDALPAGHAVAGLARAVRLEQPLLRVRVVGLDTTADAADALATELRGGAQTEIRYRDGVRQARGAQPVASLPPPVPLGRDGGVYLITGGAGGLGLLTAEHLAAQSRCHLVLCGRAAEPSAPARERIARIVASGSDVSYQPVDVSAPDQVTRLIGDVRARHGRLDGVVHAAGALRDAYVLHKPVEHLAQTAAAKVTGTLLLDEATADEPLEFFIVYSSVAGTFGSAGQTDYAFANAFLDRWAEHRRSREASGERRGRTLSVAWPMWRDGGMTQDETSALALRDRLGLTPMPTDAGFAALGRALAGGPVVVVGHGEAHRIRQALDALAAVDTPVAADPPTESTVEADQSPVDVRAVATALLLRALAEQAKLAPDSVDPEVPLENYGIDSLMITRLNRQLEAALPGLSKTIFFEYPTLSEIADHVAAQHGERLRVLAAQDGPPPAVVSTPPTPPVVASPARAEPIPVDAGVEGFAVIGLAGRYPQADDLTQFWDNLAQGRDCVTEIPHERWSHERFFDPQPGRAGRSYSRWGGFLPDADRFDPLFFGISPREAELMDPQERLFLQTAWHTVEDAGYRRRNLAGRPVGVFVGVMYGEYQLYGATDVLRGDRPVTGSSFASIANRVSHQLDLVGPSIALDTMCSSSLTAIHLACESLARGESELAIAGGVNLSLHPYKYVFLSQGRYLATDGRCRSFGAGGDGYVPGEGVGAVLLKPLAAALADGDHIHGVIAGHAVNHGGRAHGMTVPRPHAQADVITGALRAAGIDPADIDYVETHGTGTSLGDPIEISGLSRAFGRGAHGAVPAGSVPIGSVKSAIGHLESAAGIAGLTKVLLQMRHDQLAPSLHASPPNPNLTLDQTPFRVQQQLAAWPRPAGRGRYVGLSSFGAGGANAHLVVADPPAGPDSAGPTLAQDAGDTLPFLVSAANPERLREYGARLAAFVRSADVRLADLAFTLATGREPLATRAVVLARTGADLVRGLAAVAAGETPPTGPTNEAVTSWLSGADPDWGPGATHLFGTAVSTPAPRRVSAPGYPFARERCWLPQELGPALRAPHPLLDVNESTIEEVRFRKTIWSDDAHARDHVIVGRPVLAGAAGVEMARAAAELATGGRPDVLRDVVWGRPIELAARANELTVALSRRDDGVGFEIRSGRGGEATVHVRGFAAAEATGAGEPVDLDALRRDLPLRHRGDDVYAAYQRAGFEYGPSYRVIHELFAGARACLVELRLPDDVRDDAQELPPALLDGALRACHWVGRSTPFTAGDLAVPFSLGRLRIHAALPRTCYAHALAHGDAAARRFDIRIVDAHGHILAELTGFVGRQPVPDGRSHDTASPDGPDEPVLFAPAWRDVPAGPATRAGGTLLVLGGEPALAAALRATGRWERVEVSADPQAVTSLVAAAPDAALDIAHLWALNGGADQPADLPLDAALSGAAAGLDRGVGRLRTLVRDLARAPGRGPVRCLHVSGGRDESADPAQEAVAGFALSTAAVLPRLEIASVAVLGPTPTPQRLAEILASEFAAAGHLAGAELRHLAERRQQRAVAALPAVPPDAPVPFVPRGVYVLTGARGAIGRLTARHLAERYQARLVLLFRSDPDGAMSALADELTGLGAEVLLARADVTVLDDVRGALAQARHRFGRIDGVLHLAGTAESATVLTLDDTRFARLLEPKTRGTLLLDALTRDDALQVFVLYSSISGIVGDFGAAGYAAANRWLDAFAERRAALVASGARHGRTVSIGWPLWAVGGVDALVGSGQRDAYHRRTGLSELTPAQGMRALERALAATRPRVIPAFGDAATIAATLTTSPPAVRPEEAAPAGPVPAAADNGDRAVVTAHLRTVLADVLKLDPSRLDAGTSLIDYGLDSVRVMDALAVLQPQVPGLRGTVFFEFPSLGDLAEHLVAEHPDAVARLRPPAPSTPQPVTPQAAPVAHPAPALVEQRPQALPAGEPIAIIGVSGRYPGAPDLDTFWDNLDRGVDSVQPVPAQRWDVAAWWAAEQAAGRPAPGWGGFLPDVDRFDSLFFQIAPAQAKQMDPQERLFLETAWHALEDAGYPPARLPAPRIGGGRDVGVFVGVMWDDYAVLGAQEALSGRPNVVLFNRASIANQVSFFADLRGPSVVVDTACSASLVAVHQACQSLRAGECAVAVAGGVNVSVHPLRYAHLARKNMLSGDGHCRAFGAHADGYVPGEGVGAVVLKPLSKAIADGDRVHAVIRASAVNHGGRTGGFTVPNPHAQRALVEQALAAGGVEPATIGYVEAHGTGTSLGDPIEHTALTQAFGALPPGSCGLGSVKSNIGHLEGAAGIAGLTKAVLQLRHGRIVPSLHADELNPLIDFAASPFEVPRSGRPWPRQSRTGADGSVELPRRAAVSSFGAGGTNAHVIVEEYLPPHGEPGPQPGPELVVLSARTEERLAAAARRLAAHLRGPGANLNLADVAFTLRIGREPMAYRAAFVARSITEAAEHLDGLARGDADDAVARGHVGRDTGSLGDLLTTAPGAAEFLRTQILAGNDAALGRLWVAGAAVDWAALHAVRPGRRSVVSLPGYPFEAVRHWIVDRPPSPPSAAGPAIAAPELTRTVAVRAADPVVADHVVGGRALLPGTGHLHLVAGAVGGIRHRFSDVRWIRPITVPQQTAQVTVQLDAERVAELRTGATVHFRASVVADPPATTRDHLDLDEVRRRCHDEVPGSRLYQGLADAGLAYGPAFRWVERVWTGDGEALARLVAPAGVITGGADPLDPIGLDAAMHALAVLPRADSGPGMPFAADRVEILAPLPASGWSLVRAAGADRHDVDLCDDAGRVCARIRGLVLRPAPTPERTPAVPTFLPTWLPRPLPDTAPVPPARRVLVAGPQLDGPLASALAGAHPGATIIRSDTTVTDVDLIYFVAAAETEPANRADILAAQDRGVVALYRLVRSLDDGGALRGQVNLKVVTQNAFPHGDTDPAGPVAAGLAGLAGVLAKEYPSLRVACVDVRTPDVEADATALARLVVAEPCTVAAEPVSWRGGVRRVRRLRPVELPAGGGLRDGGTYLVIGGLGVLGRDTCRHLATRYGARLVIVGRSPLDAQRRAVVAEIERAGAEVEYLSADATDPGAVRAAVARARERFGALHGVINAAMVLVNRPVRDLTEADLRRALEVKIATAWALVEALRGEPLDFVLTHSSAVSIAANQGQAGYAAGCVAADALMAHAARGAGLPVRIINWGYWHAGGDSTREEVLRRATRAGIAPIDAAQGLAVVESVLGGAVEQVVAVRADRRILADLGVDDEDRVSATTAPGPSLLAAVPPAVAEDTDTDLVAFLAASGALDRIAVEWSAAVLRDAGVAPVGATAGRLYDCLAGLITDALATRAGDRLVFAPAAYRREDLAARLSALGVAHPALHPQITLLRRCVEALPDVLTGRRAPLDVLFPGGDSSAVAALYKGDPVTDHCNAATARAVTASVAELVRRAHPGPVRVLEVGAGTAGTARVVLAALADDPALRERVEYLFTDVSASFVRQGRREFAQRYPFTRFETLDIDGDLTGFAGTADIVVAANVLHATPRIGYTLAQVKRLLRPGGVLVVNEGTAPRPAMTVVFGLTDGWWAFTDPQHRLPASPLLALPAWQDVLADAGFRRVRAGSALRTPAGPIYQSVLLAEADTVVSAGPPTFTTDPVPPAPGAVIDVAPAAPDADAVARRYVASVFARVLELDASQLDPDGTFDLYGIDSLVSLEIVRALEVDLGPLPATLLFEQTTISRLADHLLRTHGPALRAATGATAQPPTPPQPEPPPVVDTAAAPEGGDLADLVLRMSDEDVTAVLAQLSTVLGNANGGREATHG
ncbi:SDR family NAD(P)-dependent oxidoreductase [Dactylosporangium sp. NPDC051484]|uniref:SDR family NAD(P)-dependent oxidoreductase n=1 Tax=Dactylosporangium sp. NPDC051484 TaxID=3154942 RepID=UPI00344CD861